MCLDITEMSKCCAIYSVIGILFQLWVGALLLYQPFYVGGIEDLETAQHSALGCAIVFVITLVLSLLGLCQTALTQHRGRSQPPQQPQRRRQEDYYDYDPVDNPFEDTTSGNPVMEAYHVSMELPASVLERANSGGGAGGGSNTASPQLSRRSSGNVVQDQRHDDDDDHVLTEQELESSSASHSSSLSSSQPQQPHVPEGQLLPTTHV